MTKGFKIEKRYNAPRVPWEVYGATFGNFLEAVRQTTRFKEGQPDFRFRLTYTSRHGGESVVIPPETFDLNHQIEKESKNA